MAVVWHLSVKMTDQKQATTKNDGQRVFLLKISFNIVKFVGSIPSKDTFALTQKMVSSKQKCFMCHEEACSLEKFYYEMYSEC